MQKLVSAHAEVGVPVMQAGVHQSDTSSQTPHTTAAPKAAAATPAATMPLHDAQTSTPPIGVATAQPAAQTAQVAERQQTALAAPIGREGTGASISVSGRASAPADPQVVSMGVQATVTPILHKRHSQVQTDEAAAVDVAAQAAAYQQSSPQDVSDVLQSTATQAAQVCNTCAATF